MTQPNRAAHRPERIDLAKKITLRGAVVVSLFVTTGCSVNTLPTYDTVRDETEAAIQRIADELPPGTRAVPRPEQSPYGCSGERVMYTGHWDIYPSPGFDGADFIERLPDLLGDDFTREELEIDPGIPAASFIADAYGGTGINISVAAKHGETIVDITALSRCAQPPE
ncbi:hypothetical protein [Microbacterium arborescens]